MDLLPVFEMLAGKCVLCNTDATAGNATDFVRMIVITRLVRIVWLTLMKAHKEAFSFRN